MTKFPISVVIPTLDEAANLTDALSSVSWADEVIVVDSHSTDGTPEIAERAGARVVPFSYVEGGPRKKNWALETIDFAHEWVLLLDADERITPELQAEIQQAVITAAHDGYCLDREFIFMDRQLRCFRPNWVLRVFKHRLGRFEDLGLGALAGTGDNEIHEHVELQGSVGLLENPLLHKDYRGLTQWLDRHNKYSTWEAHLYRKLKQEGPLGDLRSIRNLNPIKRKRLLRRIWVRLPFRPPIRFFVWYFARGGFRDGYPAFVFCILMAWYEFVIGLKLRELNNG